MKKYKLSHYCIFTDSVEEDGTRIVYSSLSSKTLTVTGQCAEFLQHGLHEHLPDQLRQILIDNQILVEAEKDELKDVLNENRQHIQDKRTLYEVIQPSANCQLGCYYCGQEHTKTNLSEEIAIKMVDRIVHKFEKGNYKKIHIGWFGAEPLMGLPQMRLVNNTLRERLEGVEITSKIVTNGLSLKEKIFLELVKDFKVDRFEVTLDGTAEYHDKHRYTKAEGPSFDLIYRNLKTILLREDFPQMKTQITIRCNVDENNIDGVEPLIDQIAKDGLHRRIAVLYFIGVFSWGGNDAHKKSLTKEEMAMKQIQWKIRKMRLGYPDSNVMPRRKKEVCIAAGGASEMYDAFGNVFNCTEVSYADYYEGTNYKLGNVKVDTKAKFTEKPHNDWFDKLEHTDKFPCHSCRILPVCGGACPKSWEEGNPACPPLKYNLRKEMEMKYLVKKTDASELEEKLIEFEESLTPEHFQRMESRFSDEPAVTS